MLDGILERGHDYSAGKGFCRLFRNQGGVELEVVHGLTEVHVPIGGLDDRL